MAVRRCVVAVGVDAKIEVIELARERTGERRRVVAAVAGIVEAAFGARGILRVGLGANSQLQIAGFACGRRVQQFLAIVIFGAELSPAARSAQNVPASPE